jgi:hypothetical protein
MTSVHDDFPGENKTHIGGVSFFSSIMVRDCWGFYFSSIQLKQFFDVVPKDHRCDGVSLYLFVFQPISSISPVQSCSARCTTAGSTPSDWEGDAGSNLCGKFISFLPALFDASANRFRVSRSDTQRQPIIISTGREMCVTVCHSRCVVLFCCCLVFSCLDNFSIDHPLIFPSVQIVMLCIPLPLSCSHLVWRSFKNPQRIKQLDQTLEWILPLLLLIILL